MHPLKENIPPRHPEFTVRYLFFPHSSSPKSLNPYQQPTRGPHTSSSPPDLSPFRSLLPSRASRAYLCSRSTAPRTERAREQQGGGPLLCRGRASPSPLLSSPAPSVGGRRARGDPGEGQAGGRRRSGRGAAGRSKAARRGDGNRQLDGIRLVLWRIRSPVLRLATALSAGAPSPGTDAPPCSLPLAMACSPLAPSAGSLILCGMYVFSYSFLA
jgi:hypothetical protein